MSALKSRKGQDLHKMGGTKLLTDKAHRDDSPSRRNRNGAIKKSVDTGRVHVEDKQITSELRKSSSTKKSGGTPMKMLIAQEMSKEIESKRKKTNVVARLMGLDEMLPAHQSVLNGEGCVEKSGRSSRVTLAGALQNSRQQEDGYFNRSLPCEVCSCAREKEYRDIYEVWQQPPRSSHFKDQPLQKGRYVEIQSDRRMALVHQKFMEAKRLATDEKLLESKGFQDALEVLSSNRDLFLKFLEEPYSLFSKHLKELQSTPAAPQTNRITVLKPSRTVEMKGDTQAKKQHYPVTNEGGWDLDKPRRSSSMAQPTRIVVLKPSPVKRHDTRPMVIPHSPSPELMEKDDFNQVLETTESIRSREAAKDIARQLSGNMNSYRRDESLLSSVLSNGYIGDESSFNMSQNEYGGEEDGNFSDAEIPTPALQHSWDYSDRYGSPYSALSISQASYSPEPSVIREAKKRLSERWSLVASNGNGREQMEVRRSSSTLGEMLAIPEVKKEEMKVGILTVSSRSYAGEEDLRVSSARSSTSQTKDGDDVEKSPWNLSRPKSLPVSSAFENSGLNSEDSKSQIKKTVIAKDGTGSKNGRSSLKGKVSSLFFSRNKKGGREKSTSSLMVVTGDVGRGSNAEPVSKENDDLLHPVYNSLPEGCPPADCEEETIKASSSPSVKGASKQGTLSFRAVLSLEKSSASASLSNNQNDPSSCDKISENQNQPSPTSVLDAPFENDTSNSTPSSEISNAEHSLAPIESVARTLSWDETNLETSSPNTSNLPRTSHKANVEEQQRHLFVQNILSTAGLDNEKLNVVFARWHSVEYPLDPILLDKFLNWKEEDAKSRERRSKQRLLFDCINSALLEIGRTIYLRAYPWARACSGSRKKASVGAFIGDEVWELISDWFSSEGEQLELDEIDNRALAVDRLLRREVGENGWAESMQSEIDEISKKIGDQVLEELVGEALEYWCLL